MGIEAGGPHGEFHIADAAQPRDLPRRALVINPSEFPDARVRGKKVEVVADEFGEVYAADFLLPFNQELDVAGKVALALQKGVNRRQTADDMTLIVAHAASEHLSITQGGLEGR